MITFYDEIQIHFCNANLSYRRNPQQKPIIVIDFMSIANGFGAKRADDVICGGRHQIALNSWKRLLDAFKTTGASLVFFSDLNIQEGKIDVWLNRRNTEFPRCTKFYDSIRNGETLKTLKYRSALSSLFYGMAAVAQTYAEFHLSIERECDLEIAQYASQNNAIAVISNDTDFLIFEGSWDLWSQNVRINRSNRLKTVEYNRHGITRKLSLSQKQLPVFATLLGNDFTSSNSI